MMTTVVFNWVYLSLSYYLTISFLLIFWCKLSVIHRHDYINGDPLTSLNLVFISSRINYIHSFALEIKGCFELAKGHRMINDSPNKVWHKKNGDFHLCHSFHVAWTSRSCWCNIHTAKYVGTQKKDHHSSILWGVILSRLVTASYRRVWFMRVFESHQWHNWGLSVT